jgi:hypothetical protein
MNSTDLNREAAEIALFIVGKRVSTVRRHRIGEIIIEFEDGTRLFVDRTPDGVEFSITDGPNSEVASG